MTFYDSSGRAVAYSDDNENIYLFNGEPVAYLHNDLVYSYTGCQLGRFNRGWIRDKSGYCVFFTETAEGPGPLKPLKQLKPLKSIKRVRPVKSIRQIPSLKALDSLSWSTLSGEAFFHQ